MPLRLVRTETGLPSDMNDVSACVQDSWMQRAKHYPRFPWRRPTYICILLGFLNVGIRVPNTEYSTNYNMTISLISTV